MNYINKTTTTYTINKIDPPLRPLPADGGDVGFGVIQHTGADSVRH